MFHKLPWNSHGFTIPQPAIRCASASTLKQWRQCAKRLIEANFEDNFSGQNGK
jgi:hypothetical protein